MTARTTTAAVDWTSVIAEHEPRLRRVVGRRVPSGLIDDVVQETFLRAYRSRDVLDLNRPIGPWLTTIAIRVAADLSHRTPKTGAAVSAAVLSVAGADVQLATMERVALIRRALAALNPRHRQLLESVALDGISQVALAQREGVAPEVIRSTLLRARQRFRVVYERLVQEHGLVGLGGTVRPVLARVRARLAAMEPATPSKAEVVTALIGLLAAGSSLVPSSSDETTRELVQTSPSAVDVTTGVRDGDRVSPPVVPGSRETNVSATLPGARLGGRTTDDLSELNSFWVLHLQPMETTITLGTNGPRGRITVERTTTSEGHRTSSAQGGIEIYCDKPKVQLQTTCQVLERLEEEAEAHDDA